MANCQKCGVYLKEGQKFCQKCGTKIEMVTPEVSAQIDILKKKIEKDSLNAGLYVQLGEVYHQNNLFKEALIEYQKAININDSNYDAHLKSGDMYLQLKEAEKAETSYKKALELNPESQEVKLGLFWVYYAQNRIKETIAVGEEITPKAKNLDVHRVQKAMYLKKELKEKAFAEMETISTLSPNDKENFREMAGYYREKKEEEKSIKYYQKILELAPKDIDAHFILGEYYCIKRDYERAIEYLKDIVEELPPEIKSFARFYLALAYIYQRKVESAINEISLVEPPNYEKLTPEEKKLFAETYYEIGCAVFERENLPVAINCLDKAIKCEPENKDYKNKLTEVKERQRIIKSKAKKKKTKIEINVLLTIVIATAGWYLTHGKILFKITPSEVDSIHIDNKILKKDLKTGGYLSPSIFFGTHKVTVEKDGYEKWEKEVKVGYGKTIILDAKPTPIYGGLEVNSDPSGAEVYLDNILLEKTPFVVDKILATNHTLRLKKAGYLLHELNITIPRKDIFHLDISLRKIFEVNKKAEEKEINALERQNKITNIQEKNKLIGTQDKVATMQEELQKIIIDFYNKKGEWAGVFKIDHIIKMRIEDASDNQKRVHAKYKYIPIPGNNKGRTDTGYDQRVFDIMFVDNQYKIISMGAYMSGSF